MGIPGAPLPRRALSRAGRSMGMRPRMIIFFGLPLVLIVITMKFAELFGIPFTGFNGEISDHRDEAFRDLNLVADLKVDRLDRWMEGRRADIAVLADDEEFGQLLQRVLTALQMTEASGATATGLSVGMREGDADYTEIIEHLTQHMVTVLGVRGVYHSIEVADARTGVIVLSTDQAALGDYIGDTEHFQEVLKSGIAGEYFHVVEHHEHAPDNLPRPELYISRGIANPEFAGAGSGEPIGALVMQVNFDDIIGPILYTGDGLGATGEALLVDDQARILTPLLHPLEDGSRPDPLHYQITADPAIYAASGLNGIMSSEDYRGAQVIAAYRHIALTPETGWGLVVKQDETEIFAGLQRSVSYTSWIGIATAVLMLATGFVIATGLTRPIRELERAVTNFGRGDRSVRTIETSGGEIGRLAHEFNTMADSLNQREKEIQEKLERSETNYRDLVETSYDLIWRVDAEGRFIYLNPAWTRTFGYKAEEMLGRPFSEFQTQEVAERDLREFGRLLMGGSVLDYQTNFITKSGEELTLLFNVFPRFKDGEIVGTRGTGRDVTEERKAQEELRVRAAVVEASGDGVIVADATGEILLANPAAEGMYGRNRSELVGSQITTLIPIAHRPAHSSRFNGGASQILGTLVETEGLRADESIFPIELRLSEVTGEGSPAYVATIRDITDRKKAEEELNVRLAALDAAAEMVMITDSHGIIEYVNNAFTDQTGYEPEDVIGTNARIQKSTQHEQVIYVDIWARISSGNVWNGTLINRRKDGSEYPEEMTITPVLRNDGEILRFIAIKRDISARVEAEQEREIAIKLESKNSELESINEARSEFLSTVSHELRTPLTTMLAFSEILRRNRDDNLTSRQLEHLELISNGGRRLNELIDDLLDVSRTETGRFNLEFAPFDIRESIDEVTRSCRSIFDQRDQVLEVVNLPRLTRLDGDRARVEQVFNNLLTNAAKYSPAGSTVEFVASVEDDTVQVEVRDHGIGISLEDQKKLFVPFFRSTNAETRKEPGTGLGLVIVKAIVERHGGSVELESQPTVGTIVRTTFPGILSE